MLLREDLDNLKAQYTLARDRMVANVNVAQGAIDAITALAAQWDQPVPAEQLALAQGSKDD